MPAPCNHNAGVRMNHTHLETEGIFYGLDWTGIFQLEGSYNNHPVQLSDRFGAGQKLKRVVEFIFQVPPAITHWRRRDRKQHLGFSWFTTGLPLLQSFSFPPTIVDGSIKDNELASITGCYFKFFSSLRVVRKSCVSQLPDRLVFALFSQLLPSPGI